MIPITPLDRWIRNRTGIGPGPAGSLFAEALADYQLRRVNETLERAYRDSPFYRRHLAAFSDRPLNSLADLARFPFTFPSDLAGDPLRFLAVRQDEVARIVTLRTSGSTGAAKRLFFTGDDLELTMDFFHHGMSTLVRPGQRVLVFLPGASPDSVGDLLVRGLGRMDVAAFAYGPITDPQDAVQAVLSYRPDCLVGIPTQVLAVAQSTTGRTVGKGGIESVLLSTDYCPRAISQRLTEAWGCRVFTHYGMTETGLGGGVECGALEGYHLREADLYFEIVDHGTGEPCREGEWGEVVFTTLNRQGTPLVRYRTGDVARILPEPCPCGSSLRRMDRVRGRWAGSVRIGPDTVLALPDMDEALFRLPGLLDYRAVVRKEKGGRLRLSIDVYAEHGSPTGSEVRRALSSVEAVEKGVAGMYLDEPSIGFAVEGPWMTTGVAKRKILLEHDVDLPG